VFQIAAVPFDEFDALDVPDGPRWLLVRLARYADREGRCFPSMRTLAAGAKKSLATVCRWLKQLYEAGCFTRTREPGRVYRYQLAERYRLRWRPGVSPSQEGVSQRARQEAEPTKDEEGAREGMKWRARLRQLREHGLRPGGQSPAAQILWRRGLRRAYLYRADLALPRRRATPAQLAALGKAMAARRTCPVCGAEKAYCIPRSTGLCNDCTNGGNR